MFINGEDVAVTLCREGLAKTDEYSATKELTEAQDEARRAKKNVGTFRPFVDGTIPDALHRSGQNTMLLPRPPTNRELRNRSLHEKNMSTLSFRIFVVERFVEV